ncbi:MAG: hypothetical protein GF398_02835 [Chitinivibrionales bacterium]|nr:hypothetical protein [Chitinivibrionales bacterium]
MNADTLREIRPEKSKSLIEKVEDGDLRYSERHNRYIDPNHVEHHKEKRPQRAHNTHFER